MLAEKLETTISRGITNTRMRDFYDIYILQKLYADKINSSDLEEALQATADIRGTSALISEWEKYISAVRTDKGLKSLRKDYQVKFSYAENVSWHEIMNSLGTLWKRATNQSNH